MADEVLSQEEIEALMSAAAGGGGQTAGQLAAEPQSEVPVASAEAPAAQPEPPAPAPRPAVTMHSQSEPAVRPADLPSVTPSVATPGKHGMDLILDVTLNVAVELGRTTMRVRDVLSMGPGSVVELNKNAGEPVEVVVNGKVLARGEVVVIDENFGVRITEVVNGKANKSNAMAA